MPTPAHNLCALLHEGHVLADESRRIPSYDDEQRHTPLATRAVTSGDANAVLAAPQLLMREDPMVLLSVFTPRGEPVAGVWTPVADLAEDAAVVAALLTVDAVLAGQAAPPLRRPDWYRVGWYDEAERWIDAELGARGHRRTAPVEAEKVGMLSAVLRVPCEPRTLWFKASCRHFHAEPASTRLVGELLPEHSPRVVATDDHRRWTLVEELPGAHEDEIDLPVGAGAHLGRIVATLQIRSLTHLAEVEAAGVPMRDLTTTRLEFDEVLTSSIELDLLTRDELEAARALRGQVHAVLDELANLGIPDALVHGDLHIGNVAHHGDALVIYDWSDAAISHPFPDIAHLVERLSDDERKAALAAYGEVWQTAYPDADVARALELAERADKIFQIVSYEKLVRAGEDASFWEMGGVVAQTLRGLPRLLQGTRGLP